MADVLAFHEFDGHYRPRICEYGLISEPENSCVYSRRGDRRNIAVRPFFSRNTSHTLIPLDDSGGQLVDITWGEPNAETSSERGLVVLLADLSGSMNEQAEAAGKRLTRIQELTESLTSFVSRSPNGPGAMSMHDAKDFDGVAEIAIGTFKSRGKDPITWLDLPGKPSSLPFFFGKTVEALPSLGSAGDQTPLGEAILQALPIIENRRVAIRATGRTVKRPVLFLITDGGPSTNAWQEAAKSVREAERLRKLLFFVMGTYGANDQVLTQLAPASYYALQKRSMSRLIEFLSTSMGTVLATDPNAEADAVYDSVRENFKKWEDYTQSLEARRLLMPNG